MPLPCRPLLCYLSAMKTARLSLVSIWLSACSSPCASAPPPAFDRLRADLGGPKTLTMTVGWPDPQLPTTHPVDLMISPDRASASASMGEVWTDGETVRVGGDGMDVPLPNLAEGAAELFAELRDGLSHAKWQAIEAPRVGALKPAADATWAEVALPFDWAASEKVLLAVDPDDGHLRYLVIETSQPPLEIAARPPRGGARIITLSKGAQLGMAVTDYATE